MSQPSGTPEVAIDVRRPDRCWLQRFGNRPHVLSVPTILVKATKEM